jgi:hypothetical protein
MSAFFRLSFIISADPPLADYDFTKLVPHTPEPLAYAPGNTPGRLSPSLLTLLRDSEQTKCPELKNLSVKLNADVVHFVVAFLKADYAALAFTEVVRRRRVRAFITNLLRAHATAHDAEKIDWVAALHLDSAVPHVHLVVSRVATRGLLSWPVNTLPAGLLPLN